MKVIVALIFLLVFLNAGTAIGDTVYRYKDEKGRWKFSDKQPKHVSEQLSLKVNQVKDDQPEVILSNSESGVSLIARNPWFAPVTFDLIENEKIVHTFVAEAKSNAPVFENPKDLENYHLDKIIYHYRLGRVISGSDGQALRPPIPKIGKFKVTQGFNGAFSHNTEGNKFAIDIAMNVDQQIFAARDGEVVYVKDDYHMGGADEFFKDKANQIIILHSDDTFSVYGHILLGSALVKPGQRVLAGDPLANAGTSGYSTGPHLHFVLNYNNGKAMLSSPFKFLLPSGVEEPKVNQWLQVISNER